MLGDEEKRRGLAHDTSALPGGINSAVSVATCSIPWRDLAGMPLPPKTVLDKFMTDFFTSVDWFIMVSLSTLFPRSYLDVDGLLAGLLRGKLPATVRKFDGLHSYPRGRKR